MVVWPVAGRTLLCRNKVSFAAPGPQTLVLAVCLSSKDVCRAGGQWVNLSAPVVVTIE